ncbi:MAG: ABC transporter permease [Magnetococcales bacterium]|nr:ABC transporter permease [Magnetococcales bacterium]
MKAMALWVWRGVWGHGWQSLLSLMGVAVGVMGIVAVELASRGAMSAFETASAALSGGVSQQVVGVGRGVEEGLYRAIRLHLEGGRAAPVVEGWLRDEAGREWRILGVDPLSEGPFRGEGWAIEAGRAWWQEENAVWITPETARRRNVAIGGELALDTPEGRKTLRIAGRVIPGRAIEREGLAGVLLMDIGLAQALLVMPGYLSRIDLAPPPEVEEGTWLEAVRRSLPEGVQLLAPEARNRMREAMTRSFRLNLSALGVLSLGVGCFLIFNASYFSVVRRREELGLLRALGVRRRQVMGALLAEGFLIGAGGGVIGVTAGLLLSPFLLERISRTVNDLYYPLQVWSVGQDLRVVVAGLLLGIGVTLLATLPAAWQAGTVSPRAVMQRSLLEVGLHRQLNRFLGAGLILGGGGLWLAWQPWSGLAGGFAGLFLLLSGGALLTVPGCVFLAHLLAAAGRRFGWWRMAMAAGAVARSPSRTGVAAAALAVACAAALGMGLMIHGFRTSVSDWLAQTLTSDLYVRASGSGPGSDQAILSEALGPLIAALPGVDSVGYGRRLKLEGGDALTELFVLDIPPHRFRGFRFLEGGDPADLWKRFQEGQEVLLSEPMAFHRGLKVGDTIRLPTLRGGHDFRVAGIHVDYGSDAGVVTMSRATYLAHWADRGVTTLGVEITREASIEEMMLRVEQAAAPVQRVSVRSAREWREASLAVFDRTFAVTALLRGLAVGVAMLGAVAAFGALLVERRREMALLRALGMTGGEVGALVRLEALVTGLSAGLAAMPLGWGVALLLLEVINKRSFGWSVSAHADEWFTVQALLLTLPAAWFSAVLAGRGLNRQPAAILASEG